MTIAITDKMREELHGPGFTVVEGVLDAGACSRVEEGMDEVARRCREARGAAPGTSVSLRNAVARHEALLDLVDHPDILPLVVDVMGWNIQNRDSVFDYKAPASTPVETDRLSLGWHFDYEEEFAGTTVDGTMPLLDFKVGWNISDHTETGHSTILLVPGSFRGNRAQRAKWESRLDPDNVFELRVPAGSVLLWRPTLLHRVSPNRSAHFRKALYISYGPRWIRPSGHVEQDPALIARSSPIRRQRLGAMGDLSDPLGADPAGAPSSQRWFTDGWESVPLKAWTEARTGSGPCDWGLGFGATYTKGPSFEFTQLDVPEGTG